MILGNSLPVRKQLILLAMLLKIPALRACRVLHLLQPCLDPFYPSLNRTNIPPVGTALHGESTPLPRPPPDSAEDLAASASGTAREAPLSADAFTFDIS
eukprot:CAMPEP_0203788788 /NCGR_PEP_ID=MMETSP0100_2-20121128/3054_1 /ASSEMBLY_ACC=CAM_ASM_000210 /TAXON_ID=96639 /ORGANISM=" , Strain NY0313808BC1" /LENGTH=98 /DNA_ID=CAMNT_0050691595 /DNA_START=1259 /DNA_END=1553 /DNA_ORIENTATION=-